MSRKIKQSEIERLAGYIMLDIEKNQSKKSIRSNIDKNLAEKVILYLEYDAKYKVDIKDVEGIPGKVQLTTYKI